MCVCVCVCVYVFVKLVETDGTTRTTQSTYLSLRDWVAHSAIHCRCMIEGKTDKTAWALGVNEATPLFPMHQEQAREHVRPSAFFLAMMI